MRYYEVLFIVHPNIENERLTQVINSTSEEIARLKGNILNIENWGKRRLAYPIAKQKYGTYILIQFETENNKLVKELDDWMKLNQSVIRHMVVVLKERPTPSQPGTITIVEDTENSEQENV